jgi:hypothetical protein
MAHRRFGLARRAAGSCPIGKKRSWSKRCHFGEIASDIADLSLGNTVYDKTFHTFTPRLNVANLRRWQAVLIYVVSYETYLASERKAWRPRRFNFLHRVNRS